MILFYFVKKRLCWGICWWFFLSQRVCFTRWPTSILKYIIWKLSRKMGCALYSGAHYTQVNMVYLHITYKNCFPTLSGKKRTVLKLSPTVFSIILKVFLLLEFIKCTTCRREKNPSFFDDSNENSRIIPSHLCCDIAAKNC